jgi:hypothetical protein
MELCSPARITSREVSLFLLIFEISKKVTCRKNNGRPF